MAKRCTHGTATGPLAWLGRRVSDEKSIVRKAALAVRPGPLHGAACACDMNDVMTCLWSLSPRPRPAPAPLRGAAQVVRVLLDMLLDGTPAPEARDACQSACTALLAMEAERCSDPVMTLRRQALVDWTDLVLAHPNQPPLWRCARYLVRRHARERPR